MFSTKEIFDKLFKVMPIPFIAVQLNPRTGDIINSIVFLGNIPSDVNNAINRTKGKQLSELNWDTKDQKIIKDYYGTSWRSMITPSVHFKNNTISGGGFDDFGTIEVINDSQSKTQNIRKTDSTIPIYSNYEIYDEDSILNLKLKIQAEGLTPFVRQHLFYYINNDGPRYPYSISFTDQITIPNILQYAQEEKEPSIAGLNINQEYEKDKNDKSIELYDNSQIISSEKNIRVSHVYFVDLFSLITPEQAKNIVDDDYSLGMLYYGAIFQFFPQIQNPQDLKHIMYGESIVEDTHNISNIEIDKLIMRLNTEKLISNNAKNTIKKEIIIISEATAHYKSHGRVVINIRNAFDKLCTNEKILAMRIIVKDQIVIKQSAGSVRPRAINAFTTFKKSTPMENAIEFLVIRNEEIAKNCLSGPMYDTIKLLITSDGQIYISGKWTDSKGIAFNQVEEHLFKHAKNIINQINKLGSSVLPLSGKLSIPDYDECGCNISRLTASSVWNHSVTSNSFKIIKNKFRELEQAGIITIKGLQQSGVFTFYFSKGMVCIPFCEDWIGRHVKLYQRATDLKFEVINANSRHEFDIIQRYLSTFLTMIAPKQSRSDVKESSDNNTLRRLQERDPDLYNLKKYDQNAKVYSMLCQSKHQPTIYNEVEKKLLTKKEQESLIKYRNHTKNEDAYYQCPDSDFPYLGFRSGVHPLGYDLPCCKKILKSNDKINIQSKHILTYGKPIAPGRYSDAPSELIDELFLGFEGKFRLYGVKQSSPSVPEAGFAFALKQALPENAFLEMAMHINNSHDTYFVLGNGSASNFSSAGELADAIINSFVEEKVCFTKFSPGEINNIHWWENILVDLTRIIYGIEIVILEDFDNVGNIKIKARNTRNASIILIMNNANGFYPCVNVTSEDKFIFEQSTKINKAIMSVLKSRNITKINFPDYFTICSFIEKNDFQFDKLFINKKNLCYAVLLKDKDKYVYLSLQPSSVVNHKDKAHFGTLSSLKYTTGNMPQKLLLDFITKFNLSSNSKFNINSINKYNNKFIGFDSLVDKLIFRFYHDPDDNPILSNKKELIMTNDPLHVDQEMYNPTKYKPSQLVLDTANRHVIYGKLQAELAHKLRSEINEQMRSDIKKLFNKININESDDIIKLKNNVSTLLEKYPEDARDIILIISNSIQSGQNINQIKENILLSIFTFDRMSLDRLNKYKTINQTIKGLHEMLDSSITSTKKQYTQMPNNVFTPCSDSDKTCFDGKLYVPKELIDPYFEFLAIDVRAPNKARLLSTADTRIIHNYKFEKRPCEYITFTKNNGSRFRANFF